MSLSSNGCGNHEGLGALTATCGTMQSPGTSFTYLANKSKETWNRSTAMTDAGRSPNTSGDSFRKWRGKLSRSESCMKTCLPPDSRQLHRSNTSRSAVECFVYQEVHYRSFGSNSPDTFNPQIQERHLIRKSSDADEKMLSRAGNGRFTSRKKAERITKELSHNYLNRSDNEQGRHSMEELSDGLPQNSTLVQSKSFDSSGEQDHSEQLFTRTGRNSWGRAVWPPVVKQEEPLFHRRSTCESNSGVKTNSPAKGVRNNSPSSGTSSLCNRTKSPIVTRSSSEPITLPLNVMKFFQVHMVSEEQTSHDSFLSSSDLKSKVHRSESCLNFVQNAKSSKHINSKESSEGSNEDSKALIVDAKNSRSDSLPEESAALTLKAFAMNADTELCYRAPESIGKVIKHERRSSYDRGVKAPTDLAAKEVGPIRLSPSKCAVKPKALVKPGLRSTKKCDVSSRSSSGAPSSATKDSPGVKKMIQKTLESYFSKSASQKGAGTSVQTESRVRLKSGSRLRPDRPTSSHKDPVVNKSECIAKRHVRQIFQVADQTEMSLPQPVVRLTPLNADQTSKIRSAVDAAGGRGKWGSSTRLAQVSPIPSPAKTSCTSLPVDGGRSYPPKDDLDSCGGKRANSSERSSPMKIRAIVSPAKSSLTEPARAWVSKPGDVEREGWNTALSSRRTPSKRVGSPAKAAATQRVATLLDEDCVEVEQDVAAVVAEAARAAQRNKTRHTRGRKVFVYCDVLDEQLERHPIQNEVPEEKWCKWLNPTQLRSLTMFMLDKPELCLKYSVEGERDEEWEDAWTNLARRLNTVCYNSLTNLNTGLRLTVAEWKRLWFDLKTKLKERVAALTPKERVHSLGSLECLLYSEELYRDVMESKGACLGDRCPRIWCAGACVGVLSPVDAVSRKTEE